MITRKFLKSYSLQNDQLGEARAPQQSYDNNKRCCDATASAQTAHDAVEFAHLISFGNRRQLRRGTGSSQFVRGRGSSRRKLARKPKNRSNFIMLRRTIFVA